MVCLFLSVFKQCLSANSPNQKRSELSIHRHGILSDDWSADGEDKAELRMYSAFPHPSEPFTTVESILEHVTCSERIPEDKTYVSWGNKGRPLPRGCIRIYITQSNVKEPNNDTLFRWLVWKFVPNSERQPMTYTTEAARITYWNTYLNMHSGGIMCSTSYFDILRSNFKYFDMTGIYYWELMHVK